MNERSDKQILRDWRECGTPVFPERFCEAIRELDRRHEERTPWTRAYIVKRQQQLQFRLEHHDEE